MIIERRGPRRGDRLRVDESRRGRSVDRYYVLDVDCREYKGATRGEGFAPWT